MAERLATATPVPEAVATASPPRPAAEAAGAAEAVLVAGQGATEEAAVGV
jgi:hypothetical protein